MWIREKSTQRTVMEDIRIPQIEAGVELSQKNDWNERGLGLNSDKCSTS